jgi:hypothetical protein
MDKSKIEHLNPQEYTHLPHAEQDFEAHEQTDVAIRPLVWTLVTIAVVVVISGIGMWGLFEVLERFAQNQPENQRFSNVEAVERREVPEGYPPLQGIIARSGNERSPAQDMEMMRRENVQILAGERPMREGLQPGMPIDRAIDEALSRRIFKTAGTQPAGQRRADDRADNR